MTAMLEEIHEKTRAIKKSLRLSMNGVVSTLQRRQGLEYKINFGVEIPRLKGIAAEYVKDKELALALWKENIRECNILAILLLPEQDYNEFAEQWIAEIRYTEIADHLAMNILCRLPNAVERALMWCGNKEGLFRYCGYITLSNVIRNGGCFEEHHEKMLIERLLELIGNEERTFIVKCATNALSRHLDNTPGAAERILESHNDLPEEIADMLKEYTME